MILCIGQSAYDITLPVSEYPEENRKIKIGDSKIECGGGSANNGAYLLGLWGSDVYLASCIGSDIYGEKIKEELRKVNVNIDYFKELKGIETTTSYIIANFNKGTRTIITNKNPKMHFEASDEISLRPNVILSDGNDADLAIKTIKNNPDCISILDAGGAKAETIKICPYVTYVACSNDFARDYTGIEFDYNDIETLKKVYDRLYNDFQTNIIITLEYAGCFTKINNEYKIIPSIPNESLDSTGAGDIFHGAFTYFISKNYSLEEALRLANIAGSLSVRKIGSKNSIPTLEEVMKYA